MAAGATYTQIATNTLGSDTASVTFSSISGSYTDLVLVINGRSTRTTNAIEALSMRFNSDTGTNYSQTGLYGDGSSASSSRDSSVSFMEIARFNNSYNSNTSPGTVIIQVQNYSNSTTYKTSLSRSSNIPNGTYQVAAVVGLWRSTSAVTSITVYPTLGPNFASGSTFSLYGITAA